MRLRCDDCRASFSAVPQERREDDGGALMYLACPTCAAEYPIVRITARGLILRRDLERARTGLPATRTRVDRLLRDFERECKKIVGRPA